VRGIYKKEREGVKGRKERKKEIESGEVRKRKERKE
jgi:hypothetical protein